MADNLSPLVNLDLINQIYKTINAQITERVYDPAYDSKATLGSEGSKYKSAWISGDTSTGTLNGLTLKKADTGTGFIVSGGKPTSKTLTVADTATISKPLEVTAATTITGSLTVSAATNIVKSLTVGAAETYTGAVTIKSGGAKSTTIVGPDDGTATLIAGKYEDSAITENSTTPTKDYLLKIGEVAANKFLAGPDTGTAAKVPTYRSIKATDLPKASASASGIVTTENQAFEGTKTFNQVISGSINGNAVTLSLSSDTEDESRYVVFQAPGNNTSKLTARYDAGFKYNPHSSLMDVGSVRLNSNVTLQYNSSSESLDFIFA